MTGVVSVAIPVLDGERYLDEVLAAVSAQEVDRELEIVVVDSGSTDRSREIARAHGAVVHEFPRASFSHGGTRNLLMELARGDHVAFITQDATPAHPRWLALLLEGFEQAEDVALSFGPHWPRPDASHMIKAEMRRHFRAWEEGGPDAFHVQRLERTPEGLAAYAAAGWRLQFFSDTNGCVARWAWERIPYRPVPYAEDQLLGREMIEAGWAKAYHPRAAVLHSHDYPPAQFLRRYFDEFRSLREVLGVTIPASPKRNARHLYGLVKADRAYLRDVEGLSRPASLAPLAISTRHHLTRVAGEVLGTNADRLAPGVRRRLSLEGRDSFWPVDVEPAALPPGPPAEPWSWIRSGFPLRPLELDPPRDLAAKPSLKVAWIVPPWKLGSGGHTTIFRLVRMLEDRGHECVVHLFDPNGRERRSGQELREEIISRFVRLEAPVLVGLDDWTGADVAIATNWWTAYPLQDLPFCGEKVYLVQDYEPEFAPRSSEYLFAEATYRMGYRCIAYTPWMATLLRERYGVEAVPFECGTDLATYRPGREELRDRATLAVYARIETARRAAELALAAVLDLRARRTELRVVTFGSNVRLPEPFPAADLGVVAPGVLASLYQRATVGLCFSLTTHSLVAQEMMASGLPVVELAGENVSSALGPSGELVVQSESDPASVAAAIERLLDAPEERRAMAGRARAFVETRTWERAGDQVEGALRGFLRAPRRSAAPRG